MTNEKIITELAMQLYGEDAVIKMLEAGIEPPLHTLQGWSKRGYKVKKGEHAVFETRLWRRKKNNSKESSETEDEEQNALPDRNFYMCKSFLFGAEQVERMEAGNEG
jgi:hypothetical protein